MAESQRALRDRLREAGLGRHADALAALARDSVRLRAGEAVSRPRAAPRHVATAVPGIETAIAIGSSTRHRVALLADGTVRSWGHDVAGQLGDGTKVPRPAPVAVRDLVDVRAIAVGDDHTLALTGDGAVFAWGLNDRGQLGDGTNESRRRPVVVPGLERGVRAVAAGTTSSFAWLEDGRVLAWGGRGVPSALDPALHRDRPAPFEELRDVVAIAGGRAYHLALTADRRVVWWGLSRELGPDGGLGGSLSTTPTPQPGLPAMTALADGHSHSLALDETGRIWAWGLNWFGERGDDARGYRPRDPAPIGSELGPVRALVALGHVSLALTAERRVVAWGHNADYALGDPEDRISRHSAMPVAGLSDDVIAISYDLALRADGTVMEWGDSLPTGAPAWDDGLPLGATKMGGRPDLPKGARWPRADGRPMTFLAQIALAEVAAHDTARLLPARGRLAVFCDLEDPLMTAALVLFDDTDDLVRPAPPRGAPPELDGAVTLEAAPELGLCPAASEPVLRLGLSQEEYWAYDELVDPHDEPRHRMLGHPDVVQDDPRRDPQEQLLLQLDFSQQPVFELGEGRLYFFFAAADLAAGRLDRARLVYQQT